MATIVARQRSFFGKRTYFMQSDKDSERRQTLDMLLLLYGKQSSRYEARRVRRRPLYVLWKNAFQVPTDVPLWLSRMRNEMLYYLDQGNLMVKGGNFKDVVLLGNHAYSFTLVKEEGTVELNSLKMVINLINEKAPEWYRKRLNLPRSFEEDIYSTQITLVDDVGQLMTLIVSRAPLCANGTLRNYAKRFAPRTKSEIKVGRFAQIVYEITKVARFLFKNEIFHLDIKPDNLFVCAGDNSEIYSFGDVDGLQFCKYSNCEKAFPPATIYFEPYQGMKFRGSDAFRNRDTYALMKTFLRLFFNIFYQTGNAKDRRDSLMRERDLDKFDLPAEPHYQQDQLATLQDIETVHTLLGFGAQYNNKEIKIDAVKEMMTLCAAMMGSIDNAFYKKSVYDKAAIDKRLKSLQKLAKKAGAKSAKKGTRKNVFDGLLPLSRYQREVAYENDTVKDVVDNNVEEMGVCWKGYRRNSKPRYSKGSCVKVKRRGGRRKRRFKEELKF